MKLLILLGITLAIAVVSTNAGGVVTSCTFTNGDLTGGDEERLANTNTESDCEYLVRSTRTTATGATWSPSRQQCYAEFGDQMGSTSGDWKTCLFNGKAQMEYSEWDGSQCKYVLLESDKCQPDMYKFVRQDCCTGFDMNNGDLCYVINKCLQPDGTALTRIQNCGYDSVYKCVRDEYEESNGACRTADGESENSFPCISGVLSADQCTRKCNAADGCTAASWNVGGICCGLTEKASTTSETGWKCYQRLAGQAKKQ